MRTIRCMIAAFALFLASTDPSMSQAPVRVGVFDSRAIAIAYAQSPAFGQEIQLLKTQFQQAKAAKNDSLAAQLETKGQTRQKLLSLQGFSIGSVSEILAQYKDAVAGVAKDANVSTVVSQYELLYQSPEIETVDITEPLVKRINDSPRISAMLDGLKNNKPLPLLDAIGMKSDH